MSSSATGSASAASTRRPLAGSGLFLFAVIGAGAAVLANVGLRPLARAVDNQPRGAAEVETNYEFVADTRAKHEATVRALIVHALSGASFELRGVNSEHIDESSVPEHPTTLCSRMQ